MALARGSRVPTINASRPRDRLAYMGNLDRHRVVGCELFVHSFTSHLELVVP